MNPTDYPSNYALQLSLFEKIEAPGVMDDENDSSSDMTHRAPTESSSPEGREIGTSVTRGLAPAGVSVGKATGIYQPPCNLPPSALSAEESAPLAEAGTVVGVVGQAPSAPLDAGDGQGNSGAIPRNVALRGDELDAGYGYPPAVIQQVPGQDVDGPSVIVYQRLLPGFAPLAGQEDILQLVKNGHFQPGRVGPLRVGQGEQPVVDAGHQKVEGVGVPVPDGLQILPYPGFVVQEPVFLGRVLCVISQGCSSVVVNLLMCDGQAVRDEVRPESDSQFRLNVRLAVLAAELWRVWRLSGTPPDLVVLLVRNLLQNGFGPNQACPLTMCIF